MLVDELPMTNCGALTSRLLHPHASLRRNRSQTHRPPPRQMQRWIATQEIIRIFSAADSQESTKRVSESVRAKVAFARFLDPDEPEEIVNESHLRKSRMLAVQDRPTSGKLPAVPAVRAPKKRRRMNTDTACAAC